MDCYISGGKTPTCSATNGLYPGVAIAGSERSGVSRFLVDLDGSPLPATHVFSIWSTSDEVIGGGDIVYGVPTSQLAGQEGEYMAIGSEAGHMALKDQTGGVQLKLADEHRLP
jgi:hypothetical protein